jgi:hypothetical protein
MAKVRSGQEVWDGSGRKTSEINGTWKQYSARFRQVRTGSWQESTGKNPNNFRLEYYFHVPSIYGVFLQDLVAGISNMGGGVLEKVILAKF